MKSFSLHALAMSAILTTSGLAQAQEKHIAVLIDGSSSFALMRDQALAKRIVSDFTDRLPDFRMRDQITIAPIGDYKAVNPVKTVRISKKFRPAKAASALEGLLLSFPDAIRKMGEPKSTNILGALDKMARRVDCSQSEGHLYVLSDGIETGQKFTLPSGPIFKGCTSFTMIGVAGSTPAETGNLGNFWMNWCKAAGFGRCDWLS